jgi:hypothetical protein
MRKMFIIALALAPIVAAPSGAQAGGWIADNIIGPVFGEHAAREADKLHEQLGKPGDKLIDAAKAAAAGRVFGGK